MATQIYQLPEGNSGNANAGGIPFSIPLGGNGGGLFGNGQTSLLDIFGFAIIAGALGMNNGGFGFGNNGGNGNTAYLSSQIANAVADNIVDKISQAINGSGTSSGTAGA